MKVIRPNQNTHDDLAMDTYWIRSVNRAKFSPVTKWCVFIPLDVWVKPEALKLGKDKSPSKVADAVGEFAKTNLDMRHVRFRNPFQAYVVAYGKRQIGRDEYRKQIVAYMIDPSFHNTIKDPAKYNFKPLIMGVPTFYITMWQEPFHMLFSFLLGDFEKSGMEYNDYMNHAIEKLLKNGKSIFSSISRKYPCFMEPWRVATLSKHGFRWVRNPPRERPKEAPNLSAFFENSL